MQPQTAIEDLTESRRALHALEVSETRYRRLFEAAKDGILILDPDTRQITDANPFIAELLGYTREEMIGKEMFEIGLLKDEEASRAAFRELREKHFIRYEDLPLESKKGQRREVEVVANLYQEDSRPVIQANIRDITERKQAKYALEVSESRYRRLFETAQDAILILDALTGEITDANPFIKKMLGYSQDELVGKELWQIGFFKDIEASQNAFRELKERGYIRYDHLPLETKSGQQIEVEFVSNAYMVDHRQVIQCNIRDISDRARLERQAQEQTIALTDLNRRKDEFLAMLSHELRNPLAPILNAVHLLRHHGDENPLRRQARAVIERQAGQLAHIVDDLMEVSRVTSGSIKLHLEHLDLRGIVEHAVESAKPLIDQHTHELSVSLPPEPVWLHADAARLEQVAVNLLNNAAKYTDKDGHIWLSVEREGDDAVLRIRDTGIGIARELLPRIFDLFTQADRSLDRSQGGLGIGLTVVQRLVEMHGGTVEANSAGLGNGSEFIVRLPVMFSPAMERESSPTEIAAPGTRWRVLVVDDNVDGADVTALLVQELGHETQVAYSGASALAAADEYLPNVVLLDIGLPEMDGYEVARRLRQHPILRNAWLVAITGYGQESDRQLSKEAGFDYHLVKPVGPEKLEDLLSLLTTQERLEK
jgi:PAS domain S-box-containing protein